MVTYNEDTHEVIVHNERASKIYPVKPVGFLEDGAVFVTRSGQTLIVTTHYGYSMNKDILGSSFKGYRDLENVRVNKPQRRNR